jgi:hypothetical protein
MMKNFQMVGVQSAIDGLRASMPREVPSTQQFERPPFIDDFENGLMDIKKMFTPPKEKQEQSGVSLFKGMNDLRNNVNAVSVKYERPSYMDDFDKGIAELNSPKNFTPPSAASAIPAQMIAEMTRKFTELDQMHQMQPEVKPIRPAQETVREQKTEKMFGEMVDQLKTLNTKMETLIDQSGDLGKKQVKATKANNANLFHR